MLRGLFSRLCIILPMTAMWTCVWSQQARPETPECKSTEVLVDGKCEKSHQKTDHTPDTRAQAGPETPGTPDKDPSRQIARCAAGEVVKHGKCVPRKDSMNALPP
jgi:hypothetical protein